MLNSQGIATSGLEAFNTPIRLYEEIVGRELGLHFTLDDSTVLDPNVSVVSDILG